MFGDHVIVEFVVIGGQNHAVVLGDSFRGQRFTLQVEVVVAWDVWELWNVRVGVGNHCAQFVQAVHHFHRWAFTHIVHVFLVGDTQYQDFAVFDGTVVVVQSQADFFDNVVGHVGVHFACQLDEAGVYAVFAGFPSQVERVDRDTVAAQAGARVISNEAERFGCGGIDDFVNIDAHFVGNDFHLVH